MRGRYLLLLTALGTGACSQASDSKAPTCDLSGVSGDDCETVHALRLPETLPPARGNRYGDDGDAAYLGFRLFFQTDLGTGVGCPTCHLPELAFTDGKSTSMGKELGPRNAPTVFNAAQLRVIFWDGRADSLWSQPLFAIENPLEMASSRLELAHYVASTDAAPLYEKVFGSLPDMSDWPAAGKPGDPAFDELPEATQDAVNRFAANVGKAFEAYMRKDITSVAALDKFLDGDASQLIPAAQRGLHAFVALGCSSCHSGPMLTDEDFHDVGFPSLPDAAPDRGRAGALAVLQNNIFNLAGPYADPGPGVPGKLPTKGKEGAFRTPSLRNVTRTAPYGHDGALPDLRSVLALHAPDATQDQVGDLLALFQTLNGDYPLPPWNNWPQPQ